MTLVRRGRLMLSPLPIHSCPTTRWLIRFLYAKGCRLSAGFLGRTSGCGGRGGIQRQIRDIDSIAKREDLKVAKTFVFEGVSGSTIQFHSDFQKMLEAITKQDCAGLIVSSPDRLMRCSDLGDLSILSPFCSESAPKLIWSADSTYDLKKLDGKLTFLMQTVVLDTHPSNSPASSTVLAVNASIASMMSAATNQATTSASRATQRNRTDVVVGIYAANQPTRMCCMRLSNTCPTLPHSWDGWRKL
jgi:hypothetical protein